MYEFKFKRQNKQIQRVDKGRQSQQFRSSKNNMRIKMQQYLFTQMLDMCNFCNYIQQFYFLKKLSMFYFVIPIINGTGVAQYPFLIQYEPIQQKISTQQNQSDLKNSFSPIILSTNIPFIQPEEEVTIHSVKNQKANSISKNQENDQQYVPTMSQPKKQKKKANQLQNRNVVPNMIRLILSFIQKKGKSLLMVQKLLRAHNPDTKNFNCQRFYLFQKAIKQKMNNYVNLQTLRQYCKIRKQLFSVFRFEEQKCYNKITKILINYFLKDQVIIFILTSKRMERQKKKHHIEVIRSLQESLRTLLNNE